MKIIVYLNEPAKYTVKLTEEVFSKFDVEYFYHLRNTLHNNTEFDFRFLEEMPLLKRWRLYYQNWKKADVIISNGYLFDFFVITFFLNFFSLKPKPIAIESDTPYLKSITIKQKLGKVVKGFYFRFPFMYGFAAGTVLHKQYFTKSGMNPQRVFLMPWVSMNYNFKEPKNLGSPFIFIYVGRFVGFKNIPIIIEEFLLGYKGNPNFQLKLVGDGPLLAELKLKYKANENIAFKGSLFGQELEDVFKTSHALVLASTPEMWGLVVNEALSAGMPVLLSEYAGCRYDLIDNKETGLIFDPLVKGDLAKIMHELSNNAERYMMYSKNAKTLMHEKWNYSFYEACFANATKQLYTNHK